jgi:hypothetical protein
MYTDLFLSFPDEATAKSVLYEEYPDYLDDAGDLPDPFTVPKYRYIETIGVIYKPTGEVEGWHVKVQLVDGVEDPAPLLPYAVTPSAPQITTP